MLTNQQKNITNKKPVYMFVFLNESHVPHFVQKKNLNVQKKTWTSIKKNGNITGKTKQLNIKKINKSQNTIK